MDPPNVLKEQTLHINIMEPPLDQARPTLAPGVRLGMSVSKISFPYSEIQLSSLFNAFLNLSFLINEV